MKASWRTNPAAKFFAVLSAILFLCAACFSGILTIVYGEAYTAQGNRYRRILSLHSNIYEIVEYYRSTQYMESAAEHSDERVFRASMVEQFQQDFDEKQSNLRFAICDGNGELLLTNDSLYGQEQELLTTQTFNNLVDYDTASYGHQVHFKTLSEVLAADMSVYLDEPSDFQSWYFTDDQIDWAFHNGVDVVLTEGDSQTATIYFDSLKEAAQHDYIADYGMFSKWKTVSTDAQNGGVAVEVTYWDESVENLPLEMFLERKSIGDMVMLVDDTLKEKLAGGFDITINAAKNVSEPIIIQTYLPAALPVQDSIREEVQTADKLWGCMDWLIGGTIGFLVLSVVACILLCLCAGCKKQETVTATGIHKIAYELYCLLLLLALMIGSLGLDFLAQAEITVRGKFFVLLGICLLAASIFVLWLYTTAVRTKSGTFWSSFGIVRILRFAAGLFRGRLIVSIAAIVLMIALFVMNLFVLPEVSNGLLILFLDIAAAGLVLYCIYAFYALKRRAEGIEAGEPETKASSIPLVADFQEFSHSLDHMSDNIAETVAQQTKSERMRSELITNVSHDLKTPLTSIVSYIDLLSREPMQSEQAEEYIGVLQRQSARLKKLTEDLVEASKASTGSLSVDLQPTDMQVLISQLSAEYADRFETRGLELISTLPEQSARILADSRHICRVFDNLLGNAYKYSMPSTRIYLHLTVENGLVRVEMKNVSEHSLNISPEELTERFVRGDVSRHTEGSGLGLSIAKDLTALQGGTLEIQIDGDLFKVLLTFPEYME